jgi:hypothetical protein
VAGECSESGRPVIQFSKQIALRPEIISSSLEITISIIENDVRFDSKPSPAVVEAAVVSALAADDPGGDPHEEDHPNDDPGDSTATELLGLPATAVSVPDRPRLGSSTGGDCAHLATPNRSAPVFAAASEDGWMAVLVLVTRTVSVLVKRIVSQDG